MIDLTTFVSARLAEEDEIIRTDSPALANNLFAHELRVVAEYTASRAAMARNEERAADRLHNAFRSMRALAARWDNHDDYRPEWGLTPAEADPERFGGY